MTAQPDPLKPTREDDKLLDALAALTRLHHRPFSPDSLIAGLPLEGGQLTPALFVRAAERAGFAAAHVQRDLGEIPTAIFPVAAHRTDGSWCLVLARDEDSVTVAEPATPETTQTLDLADFKADYEGDALFFRASIAADSDDTPGAHWFWHVINRSRGIYAEVLVASFLVNLFALVTPLFVMNVYDRVVPNQAFDTLWVLASGVTLVFVFDLVMKLLRGYFIDTAGKRSDILLSASTFERVLDIRMNARPGRIGSFANNLQEFDAFREFFTSTTLIALIDLPFVLLFIALIYMIGGSLALVPVIAIPLILIIGLVLQKPLQAVVKQSFSESARKHAMLIEALANLDTIKGVRAEGVMQRRWEVFNANLAKLSLRSRFLSLLTVNTAQTVQQLGTVAVVIFGVYAITRGELSVGGLIACTILTGRCLAPMSQIANILTRLHHSLAAYRAIDNLMGLPVERPPGRKFVNRPEIGGAITLRNVTFSYPGQSLPALRDVTLDIKAGEKVAIIGKTGSGKTTLQRLIMKFYLPDEGTLLVDGTDINQVDPTDLRRNTGYVPQDITLFDGSIRENIVLGDPRADDAAVLEASRLAGIDEFIDQHPDGYDLAVGERGGQLSGGQRQGIAIARAVLGDRRLLLFDEPSNAMDNATEQAFIGRLGSYVADKTLILVTHKTTLLSLVDRLIVLNNGQLVADGPRDEVLQALRGGKA